MLKVACMVCDIIYSEKPADIDGLSHGLCNKPECYFYVTGELPCTHSNSSLMRSRESSSVRKNMDSSLPSS